MGSLTHSVQGKTKNMVSDMVNLRSLLAIRMDVSAKQLIHESGVQEKDLGWGCKCGSWLQCSHFSYDRLGWNTVAEVPSVWLILISGLKACLHEDTMKSMTLLTCWEVRK